MALDGSAIRPTNASAPYSGGTQYADTSKFVPELYGKKVLRNFYETTVYQSCFNTDFEGEIKGQGSKVWIRNTPKINVFNYSIGDTINYEVPTEAATSLSVDQGIYSAFQVDDINAVQADIGLVNLFAKDAGHQVKIACDKEVLTYISTRTDSDNTGNTAGAISGNIPLGAITGAAASVDITAANAIEKIVDLNAVLDEQNIPNEGRWVILPAWYCAFLKKGDLRQADITGDATGVIRNGIVGMVDRTMVYQSNNLYSATDGDTETSWYIMAGTSEACTFAAQIDKVDTIKIPDSFGEYWRTLFVYGRAVVQPTALAALICKPVYT